jgi:nitrogen regulatory protein P-II 1
MKQIQIVIPNSVIDDLNDILKNAQVGGMSHYRIEGSTQNQKRSK